MLRHGQSEWNAAGLFTGWENAHLTAHGELEAARAGTLLAEHGVLPAFAHTSLLRRTIRTTDLALAAADRDWIPVRRSWRLNGRHYGALQGRYKADVLRQHGEEQFRLWRRSYHVPPPPSDAVSWSAQSADPRYLALPPEVLPRAESLADVSDRLLPYWYDAIVPDLRAGGCVLVVSHGNTLRALVKQLESIPDDLITELRTESLADVSARLLPYWRSAIVPDSGQWRMRARRLAWQHAAGAGQAARIHPGRPDRRAGHPHRHPAGLRLRTRPAPGRPGPGQYLILFLGMREGTSWDI